MEKIGEKVIFKKKIRHLALSAYSLDAYRRRIKVKFCYHAFSLDYDEAVISLFPVMEISQQPT